MSEVAANRFALATVELHEGGEGLQPAVVTDTGVMPLVVLLGSQAPPSLRAALSDWNRLCDAVASALESSTAQKGWIETDSVTFAPPLPDPGALYLTGANYYDHIAEMGRAAPDKSREDVFHFMVPAASLTGDRHSVVRPRGVDRLDWEVELAAVIGRRAVDVKVANALDYVAGYTVANDVSARDEAILHPIFGVRFVFAKGQATLTPLGPAIVPARFVPDPGHLRLTTHVNGVLRQDSNTEQMIWSLEEQISFLSGMMALEVGDVILTGTPAGTAAAHGTYLADGDVMTLKIEGIGTLTNTVVASP